MGKHTDNQPPRTWLTLEEAPPKSGPGEHLYYVDLHYNSEVRETLIRSVGIYGHLWARDNGEAREKFLTALRDLNVVADCIENVPVKASSAVGVYPLERTEPAGEAEQRMTNTCPECTEAFLEQRGGESVCPKCGFILPRCE